MKKIIIYVLLFSIVFILYMCNFTKYKYYNPISKKYNSFNVKESKEFKVFIAEYIPESYEYIFLGDTLNIDEIWLEKFWVSTYFWNELDTTYNSPKGYYNVFLRYKNNTSSDFVNSIFHFHKMIIYNSYHYNTGIGNQSDNLIVLTYTSSLAEDTLVYPVFKGSYSNYKEINEKLGEIKLFKKK